MDEACEAVLRFWFGELKGLGDVDRSKNELWWKGTAKNDAEIRRRFGALVQRALAGELDHWCDSARGALALVILLDQFTRTIGRGNATAFAGDGAAQRVCLQALEAGRHRELAFIERSFMFMPLMHAEDRTIARRSVEVFSELSKEITTQTDDHPDFLKYAKNHAEIVERFGRFPHRNALLGRADTDEETAYLAAGAPSFGQKRNG